jgi:zinc protease
MTVFKLFLSFFILLASMNIHAQAQVQRLDWNGLEVVWLVDQRFPTYSLSIYFADGALSDERGREGESAAALNMIISGTNRFDHREIAENLEFFGVRAGAYVTHEYSTYTISGLTKDLIPTMKKICHLFNDAIYPRAQVDLERNRAIEGLNNLISQHGPLASRAHRELSLKGSPYAEPVNGKVASLRRIQTQHLKSKLEYFNKEVKKRLYITGPRSVLGVQRVIQEECGWGDQRSLFTRRSVAPTPAVQERPQIYLVPVPDANQAQIRIGRLLDQSQIQERDLMMFVAELLGGGFTSILLQELRVKRGLTYSAHAIAAAQRDYGRSLISTSTANENLENLLNVTRDSLQSLINGELNDEQFRQIRQGLAGSYPFRFESIENYLAEVMTLDHAEIDLKALYNMQNSVMSIKLEDVPRGVANAFDWNQQIIVVVGDRSLEGVLKKFGKVQIIQPGQIL